MKLTTAPKRTIIRAKVLKIVEHIHERIFNKCEYFVQKTSFNLVRTYDLITFEDLNVKGIIKSHCLAKNIADASWNKLMTITTYRTK